MAEHGQGQQRSFALSGRLTAADTGVVGFSQAFLHLLSPVKKPTPVFLRKGITLMENPACGGPVRSVLPGTTPYWSATQPGVIEVQVGVVSRTIQQLLTAAGAAYLVAPAIKRLTLVIGAGAGVVYWQIAGTAVTTVNPLPALISLDLCKSDADVFKLVTDAGTRQVSVIQET